MAPEWIIPDWPAPSNVGALQTTRQGGVSQSPYASLNLGDHVGDEPRLVMANRQIVQEKIAGMPLWLRQVHGVNVLDAEVACCNAEADAAIAHASGRTCVVMTADCLPVLLCDRAGTVVAAVHAGWRSLCAGILERTAAKMACPGDQVIAWLGPAIGPQAFEVGDDVRSAFLRVDARADHAFVAAGQGKWLADIYKLARQRLSIVGVSAVFGGQWCTVNDCERFFSYRREGVTGRMGSFIWLKPEHPSDVKVLP